MADEVEEAEGHLCVICLGEVIKPITPKCGHTICMSSLSNETFPSLCCAACQEVYQLRTPQADIAMHQEGKSMCEIHQEDQKLFCDNNKTLLCVNCSESEDHENHTHWLIAMAAVHYREKIQINLEMLCRMGNKVQELLKEKEESFTWTVVWIDYTNTNRRTFQKKFKQIWEYLTRKKKVEEEKVTVRKRNKKFYEVYQRLKEMEAAQEHQIMKEKREWEAMMSSQSRFLTAIIAELKEKLQKPYVEMLQDVAETLERSNVWLDLEPYMPSVDNSYLIVVTKFLKFFERHKLSETCNFYSLSEEKKRAIIIVPDFSGKKYPIYIFGSIRAEDIIARRFIVQT